MAHCRTCSPAIWPSGCRWSATRPGSPVCRKNCSARSSSAGGRRRSPGCWSVRATRLGSPCRACAWATSSCCRSRRVASAWTTGKRPCTTTPRCRLRTATWPPTCGPGSRPPATLWCTWAPMAPMNGSPARNAACRCRTIPTWWWVIRRSSIPTSSTTSAKRCRSSAAGGA
ncbi:hypothetical protein D3C78_705980 [compost metagenome]